MENKQKRSQEEARLLSIFTKWLKDHTPICYFIEHFTDFWYIWAGLLALLTACLISLISWGVGAHIIGISLSLIAALILLRPMNAVYGLMGTSGSIHLFFIIFLFITFVFAQIYYWGFFSNAGISYDVNQPHIDYNLYAQKCPKEEIVQSDTFAYKRLIDSIYVQEGIVVHESKINYQTIGFWFTWRNTIMTALMQEPTEFFSAASTYNESMVDPHLSSNKQLKEIELDKQKAKMFQWVLIFQVLISWIFFGVFISLLYNKFRYES